MHFSLCLEKDPVGKGVGFSWSWSGIGTVQAAVVVPVSEMRTPGALAQSQGLGLEWWVVDPALGGE